VCGQDGVAVVSDLAFDRGLVEGLPGDAHGRAEGQELDGDDAFVLERFSGAPKVGGVVTELAQLVTAAQVADELFDESEPHLAAGDELDRLGAVTGAEGGVVRVGCPDLGAQSDSAVVEAVGPGDGCRVVCPADVDAGVDLGARRNLCVAAEACPAAGRQPGVAAGGSGVQVQAAPIVFVGVGSVQFADQCPGRDPAGRVAGADELRVLDVGG